MEIKGIESLNLYILILKALNKIDSDDIIFFRFQRKYDLAIHVNRLKCRLISKK